MRFKLGNFYATAGFSKKSGQFISSKNIQLLLEYGGFNQITSNIIAGPYGEANMLKLFTTLPEVFAPVDQIADRVASGTFTLRKIKAGKRTDEVVEDNKQWNKLLAQPNWQESLYDMLYSAVVYELVCGNRYWHRFIPESIVPRFENITSIWLIPPQYMTIREKSSRTAFFRTTESKDVIEKYEYTDGYEREEFMPEEIKHEAFLNLGRGDKVRDSKYKGFGPLQAADKPMANLIAVYSARNVIFTKRGALGFFISEKGDADGRQALTKLEKEEMLNDFNSTYGLEEGKSPVGITRMPVSWVKTAMSIQELQPFEECKEDQLAIMHILKVPKEAMASTDGAKYENQQKAIANFYRNTIIPKGESLADILTKLLMLERENLYVHASYDHVEELQEDKKLKAEVDWKNSETNTRRFHYGQITLNDWRVDCGLEPITGDGIYDKTLLQMDEDEQARIERILNIKKTINENQNTENNEKN